MAILNINSIACAFGDVQATSNPKRKYFDWQTNLNGITVSNPKSEQYVVPPRQLMGLFNGTRSTTVGATTAFNLEFMADSRYRITWTGAGTDPTFAADVALSFGATSFTAVVNENQTLTITAATNTPFAGITTGYSFYIKGSFDSYVGAFNVENQGLWKILTVSDTVITLARPTGVSFTGISETVSCTSADMLCYFLSNVQVGDKVAIEAGFALETRTYFSVTQVTSKWIEVVSATPLAEEAGIIPGSSGMFFYSSAKRFIRIEVDQEAKAYFNGSTDGRQYVQPWVAGDPEQTGWTERVGITWQAAIYNVSLSPMIVNIFSVE